MEMVKLIKNIYIEEYKTAIKIVYKIFHWMIFLCYTQVKKVYKYSIYRRMTLSIYTDRCQSIFFTYSFIHLMDYSKQ